MARDGEPRPGGSGQGRSTPGLSEVARLAGVSESTASRVLTNSRPVGSALRERVLDAAARLDYSPNPHARALASSRDSSVGVVVHDVTDPYFSEILRGALDAAEATERILLICNSYRDVDRELAYIRHFRMQRVHALLLAGSGRLDREAGAQITSEILAFERAGGRAALIGRHDAVGDSVQPDNVAGGQALAQHLVSLGHRRIGVVTGPPLLTTTHDRLVGFRRELSSLGVELGEDRIRPGNFTRSGGEAAGHQLLNAHPTLTAIVALNDVMAIGVLAALRAHGRQVPADVSVAGFDDIPVARDLSPALTTVHVPMFELGRRAFELALGPADAGFRIDRLATELVVRESTGRPRPGRRRAASADRTARDQRRASTA